MNKPIKLLIFSLYAGSVFAESSNCDGLLNIVNSPSAIDSTCTVPNKKILIELNYFDQQLPDHEGVQQNFPNAEIRIGLPSKNEFFIYPPNYIDQKNAPGSGNTTSALGLKHNFEYGEKWTFALEGLAILPGGSYAYGSAKGGAIFRTIASYSFTKQWSLSGMLGFNRQSDPQINGGHSYNSISPYMVLTYNPNDKLSFYGEVYGQSKIGALEGSGFNFDGGFIVLLTPKILFNLSGGQQLYNYLNNFKHYINLGVDVMLDV